MRTLPRVSCGMSSRRPLQRRQPALCTSLGAWFFLHPIENGQTNFLPRDCLNDSMEEGG